MGQTVPKSNSFRQYVVIILVALGISLLLSPPTFQTERAAGAGTTTGLPTIETSSRLTVRLAQTLGQGEFRVAAKNLQTGETYSFGPTKTFDAASTMKLLFAASLYQQAANRQIDLDQVVTIPAAEVQHYGTGTIQYQPGPYRYSYRELARLMMEQSDNTAAHVIAGKLGVDTLQALANRVGMNQTSVTDDTTTPGDMIKLVEALYRNRITDPATTQQVFGIMDESAFEDRLPAKLPDGAKVYHKTGDALGGGLHDVGLVEYRGRAYAVAIFTNRQGPDRDDTKDRIAEASRDLFAYFNRTR